MLQVREPRNLRPAKAGSTEAGRLQASDDPAGVRQGAARAMA